jgi:DNA repair protein RadC
MAISDWPASERPRERLIRQGPAALSDAELLALFLRVGIPGKDAVALARDALTRFGSLHALLQASLAEFSTVPGLGAAKYSQLQAALELARRTIAERLQDGHVLSSPQAVREFLTLRLRNKPYEAFHVLFLDVKNRLIDARELFRGTLTHTSVYPREVVREALAYNAAGLMLVLRILPAAPIPASPTCCLPVH